ncbi:hypothetical protein ABZV25_12550 [Micrococcus luteus]
MPFESGSFDAAMAGASRLSARR